jgi:disulfide oxidoreductase YuzD
MPRILFIILFLLILGVVIFSYKNPGSKLSVLGIFSKSSYTIAVYGDSMVDTMGENLEYLQAALKRHYPNTTFYFYNYGIGSQNVEQGLERFGQSFDYKTRHYPAISSLKPDIIIVGSFGYNPFFPYDRDKHWNTLTKLVAEAKNTGADVYMLSEIAPLKNGFGKGPNGVSWQDSELKIQSQHISELLENSVYLARDHLKIPSINAYAKTAVDEGRYGSSTYTNSNDGIHPSVAGHQLMAELIASTIRLR